MNFSSFDYFLALARERSYTRAADVLHITQQSLSAAIAALERELGCRLVVRRTPLELTYAGRVFLQYAERFHQTRDETQRTFCDIAENQRGELRVGIAYTRGRAILLGILEAFAGVYPNVRVILAEERNHTLQNLLHEGRVDLAIARFQKPLPGIEVQPFYTEDTVLLVSRQLLQTCGIDLAAHRTEIERGDLRSLRGCPFVSGSAEDITGSLERDAFRRAGFVPEVRAESSNVETLLELCARGVGACFCPENLAQLLLAAQPHGRLEMLRMPDTMAYPISFGYAKRAYLWSVLADFIRIARAQYPQPT